jgi:hypothetical protein
VLVLVCLVCGWEVRIRLTSRVGGGQKGRGKHVNSITWTEGKTRRLNPERSCEAHVVWISSNLTDSIHLGLTLQIFKTL